MRDDIGLGAFLDREGVLEDRRAILAEGHRMATGLDLEWTGHSRGLDRPLRRTLRQLRRRGSCLADLGRCRSRCHWPRSLDLSSPPPMPRLLQPVEPASTIALRG